jgi:hypothetical protein
MKAFLVGLGIGSLICVATMAALVNKLDNLGEQIEKSADSANDEYSVIVKIKLSDDQMGTDEELHAGFALEDQLSAFFDDHSEVGEFNGDGVGLGYFDLYMYTSNPENAVDQIMPIIRAAQPGAGSYIVTHVTETGADEKRYDV